MSARFIAEPDPRGGYRIFDQDVHGYPAVRDGQPIPATFDTADDAQAWADEHLNQETPDA